MNKHIKEPMFHIVKRGDMPWYFGWTIRAIALVLALVTCGLISTLVTGENPIQIYATIIDGSFGSMRKFWVLLQNTSMLLCIALALTPAFKMRFWNLGGEGQALAGALAAAACMILMKDQPNSLVICCMIVTSILAGALWGAIPALFKAKFNTNETLFTLMMNYVAMTLVSYFIMLKDRSGRSDLGILNERTGYGYLPDLFGMNYIFNILIVLGVVVFMFIYLKYSKQGYEISVVGESENTARYIGINVKKVIIRTVAISGAICGLVGFMIVAGDKHSIKPDIVGGQGFTAIMVSWMAKFNPIIMVPVSLLIVFLSVGSKFATSAFKVDNSIGDILTAIVIFSIIACEFFTRYKVNFRKFGKEG